MVKKTISEAGIKITEISLEVEKKRKTISLKEVDDFYSKAKEEIKDFKYEEVTEIIKKMMIKLFFKVIANVHKCGIVEWGEKNISLTDEELNIMEKNINVFETIRDDEIAKYNESISKEDITKARNELKELKEKVQKEKVRRQNSPDIPIPSPGPNDDQPNDKDRGNNPPLSPDNIKLNKQITNLQSQINTLEEKKRRVPSSETSQQDNQELNRLKSELKNLKAEREQKNSKNPKSNDFPLGMSLAIGGGVVIVILLLVVAFYIGKNKNKNN